MDKTSHFFALFQTWKFPEVKRDQGSQFKAFINRSKNGGLILKVGEVVFLETCQTQVSKVSVHSHKIMQGFISKGVVTR